MAATHQALSAPASPIEKLPAELLERIHSYTVSDIRSPIWLSEECQRIFRWREQGERGLPTTSQHLQIRLVCRKFRDLAWRAFGEVLGETLFDLGSRDSIYHLHAVAEQQDLTPWVQKLTFTCNILYREFDDLNLLSPRALEEWDSVRQRERGWIPGALAEVRRLIVDRSPPWTEANSQPRVYAANMRKTLGALTNIEEVAYMWDEDLLPQRYKKVWELDSEMHSKAGGTGPEALSAHFGLTITFEALAAAGIRPKSLDIVVEMTNFNHAFMYAASTSMSTISEEIETLASRDRYYPISAHRGIFNADPRIAITKTMFPLLRSLILDHDLIDIESNIPNSAWSDTPDLRHLTIIQGGDCKEHVRQWLKCCGRCLDSFRLCSNYPWDLGYIIDSNSQLELESLSPNGHSQHYRRRTRKL
jgi:hypothetical protein